MDRMHDELTTAADDQTVMPALRAALRIGKKLLNKYYSLTDHSDVYRISVGKSLSFMILVFRSSSFGSFSSSSPLQTEILREARMGLRLGEDCQKYRKR